MLCLADSRLTQFSSKNQPTPQVKHPDTALIRIQRRVFQVLKISGHGETLPAIEPIKDLGRILIIQARGKGIGVRFTPVKADTEQAAGRVRLVAETHAERFLE